MMEPSDIVTQGMRFPDRMNAYNRVTGRFIRWLKGCTNPVPQNVGKQLGLSSGWFLHKNLYLNWSEDGYFEMSRKDSDKFNSRYNYNMPVLRQQSGDRTKQSVQYYLDTTTSSSPSPKTKPLSETNASESTTDNAEADGLHSL